MAYQINKQVAYDNAVYVARQKLALAASTAGSGGTFGRYVAQGNEVLFAAGASQVTAGTSTYTTTDTSLVSGVVTVTTNTTTAATLITPFRVSGTSTTTGITFPVGASRTANFSALTTNAGSVGITLSQGDVIYMTNGTDATAVSIPVWEIGFAPNSQ
jgi:hypothetical protein